MEAVMRYLIVILLFPACAAAQPIDPDPDGMSVFLEYEGEMDYCMTMDDWFPAPPPAGPGTITVFLLLTRPSTDQDVITNWEARVDLHCNSLLAPDVMNVAYNHVDHDDDPDDYVIEGYIPLSGDSTILAWFDIEYLGYEGHVEIMVELAGVEGSQVFSDGPGYQAHGVFPCQSMLGSWGPMAWVNGPCATIADERMAWGAVKSLY